MIGTPWSGPQRSPFARARSAARARRRAAGMSVSTIAFSRGLNLSTRARYRSSSSRLPTRPRRIIPARRLAEENAMSVMASSPCAVASAAPAANPAAGTRKTYE